MFLEIPVQPGHLREGMGFVPTDVFAAAQRLQDPQDGKFHLAGLPALFGHIIHGIEQNGIGLGIGDRSFFPPFFLPFFLNCLIIFTMFGIMS